MKTEDAQMTAEANQTRPNGRPSLSEQHCFSFGANRLLKIISERIMLDNRGFTAFKFLRSKMLLFIFVISVIISF